MLSQLSKYCRLAGNKYLDLYNEIKVLATDITTLNQTKLSELQKKVGEGKIVFAQVDIEGARLLKQKYGATTIFIMPESIGQFKTRLHARSPEWSQKELEERMHITEEELRVHAPQYDYRVVNADGMLSKTVEEVVAILKKEGYNLL